MLSSNFSCNGMGCDFFTIDVLHLLAFQNNVIKGSEKLSCQNVSSFECQNFNDRGREKEESIKSSGNCKFNTFNKKTIIKEKETEINKKYRKIYVIIDLLQKKTDYDNKEILTKNLQAVNSRIELIPALKWYTLNTVLTK